MKNILLLFILAILFAGCESYSKHPISEAKADTYDARLIGKWKLVEDTNKNNYYLVQTDKVPNSNKYHVRFYNRGGTNPTYESSVYFSKVGKALFLNIPYWFRNADKYEDIHEDYKETRGYFFVKVLDLNEDYNRITTATVLDDQLANVTSSAEVYARIEKHIDDPSYYHDTVHLYKVK